MALWCGVYLALFFQSLPGAWPGRARARARASGAVAAQVFPPWALGTWLSLELYFGVFCPSTDHLRRSWMIFLPFDLLMQIAGLLYGFCPYASLAAARAEQAAFFVGSMGACIASRRFVDPRTFKYFVAYATIVAQNLQWMWLSASGACVPSFLAMSCKAVSNACYVGAALIGDQRSPALCALYASLVLTDAALLYLTLGH